MTTRELITCVAKAVAAELGCADPELGDYSSQGVWIQSPQLTHQYTFQLHDQLVWLTRNNDDLGSHKMLCRLELADPELITKLAHHARS